MSISCVYILKLEQKMFSFNKHQLLALYLNFLKPNKSGKVYGLCNLYSVIKYLLFVHSYVRERNDHEIRYINHLYIQKILYNIFFLPQKWVLKFAHYIIDTADSFFFKYEIINNLSYVISYITYITYINNVIKNMFLFFSEYEKIKNKLFSF